jgi:hypothetical protein
MDASDPDTLAAIWQWVDQEAEGIQIGKLGELHQHAF